MDRNNQQGSALLLVVVILLVLSGLGMAMLALTDTDRETVSWDNHVKDALYVAEMGLRSGEAILTAATAANADGLLQFPSTTETAAVTPHIPVFPQLQNQYTTAFLGTYLNDNGTPMANVKIPLPPSPTGQPLPDAFFSLYVRNNPNDVSVSDGDLTSNANEDDDFRINLISVAWVARGGQILAVKILEEEYAWAGINQDPSSQKGSDTAGTSSGVVG